jgi:diacylglycerol kinase (ATP)
MPGLGIITNPHSKLNKRYPERQRLLSYIVGDRGKLELTSSLEDLARVAVTFKERKVDCVGINGGDGTICRTLTAIIRAYGSEPLPKILILRGGTINVLAENVGVKGSPEEILVRYIESQSGVRHSKTVSLQTLKVEDHYGFLFGQGVVANYLEEFYLNKTGALGAVLLLLKMHLWFVTQPRRFRDLIGTRSYRFFAELASHDGRALDDSHSGMVQGSELSLGVRSSAAVMCATIERMPLGPRLFPLARSQPGAFQFFSLDLSHRSIVFKLPLTFLRLGEGDYFGRLSRLVHSLRIVPVDPAPQKYTLDGEIFTARSPEGLEISLGPTVELVVV